MSNKLVKKRKFENITFTELGLDEDFNFLEAPCCECGNKMTLETDDMNCFPSSRQLKKIKIFLPPDVQNWWQFLCCQHILFVFF